MHVCLAFLLYLLELGDFKALLDVPKLYLFGHDLFQGAIQLPFQAHYQYGLRLALAGHPALRAIQEESLHDIMLLLKFLIEQPVLGLLLGHVLLKLIKFLFQGEVLVVKVLWTELRGSRFPSVNLIFEVLEEEARMELHSTHTFMRVYRVLEEGVWLGRLVWWRHNNVIGLLDK